MLGILAIENHDRRLAAKLTDGNANIMIPRMILPKSELVETLWYFSEENGAVPL